MPTLRDIFDEKFVRPNTVKYYFCVFCKVYKTEDSFYSIPEDPLEGACRYCFKATKDKFYITDDSIYATKPTNNPKDLRFGKFDY